MSGFVDGLQQFAAKVPRDLDAVFVTSVTEMREAIKFGSAVTGAPPMPVSVPKYPKSGSLRDSVIATYTNPTTALIYTTKWFAPNVEWNTENHTFTSGGPHGWGLTAAAFPRIVENNARRLAGSG